MSTRREVLWGLAGAGALGLGACRTSGAASGAVARVLPLAGLKPVISRVAVVRPSTYPTLAAATREVIERAGGLGFIAPGQTVLLKPATNSARKYPATSDPEVVLAVARLVLEAGGQPLIADRTMFMNSTAIVFHKLGFDEAAHQAGIRCTPLDDAEVVEVTHALASHWSGGAVPIYRPVHEADHVINLCTPRTHRIGDFTMAMKNNVGVVAGGSRMRMHFPMGFKDRLAEISLVLRPSLVLMDGRQGFTDGGPDEGDLARLDFLAASTDPLAIDAVGLGQLRLAGANKRLSAGSIWQLPLMKRAVEVGIGAGSAAQIQLLGLPPAEEARLRVELA